MSTKEFHKFLSILGQEEWSDNDSQRVMAYVKDCPEFCTRKLEKNLCVDCRITTDWDECDKCRKVCIPKGNNSSYVALCWNSVRKLQDSESWLNLCELLKKHGVTFDRRISPYEQVKHKPATAYTVFQEKVKKGHIGYHDLTEKDFDICDRLLRLANTTSDRHIRGRRHDRRRRSRSRSRGGSKPRSPPPKRCRQPDEPSPFNQGRKHRRPLFTLLDNNHEGVNKRQTDVKFAEPPTPTSSGYGSFVPSRNHQQHSEIYNGAPPNRYISAEEAFKIRCRSTFRAKYPSSKLDEDDLRQQWLKVQNEQEEIKQWVEVAFFHNQEVAAKRKQFS